MSISWLHAGSAIPQLGSSFLFQKFRRNYNFCPTPLLIQLLLPYRCVFPETCNPRVFLSKTPCICIYFGLLTAKLSMVLCFRFILSIPMRSHRSGMMDTGEHTSLVLESPRLCRFIILHCRSYSEL